MAKVKCLICEEMFDKSKVEYLKVNNRYVHKTCYEETEMGEKLQLEQYIKQIMHLDKITPLIKKQIENYNSVNKYTYKSILFTLKYFYEIEHGD